MNKSLKTILDILTEAAEAAKLVSGGDQDVSQGANVAEALIRIAQKANAAHIAETGKPIDATLLHQIEPVT